ncbi:MAG TPA: hypothetical protein VHV29_21090 [Terriglobales bacterium]|jgi:hypothetical protein|nr:hypothetical protein [Terriglobales bacterium]
MLSVHARLSILPFFFYLLLSFSVACSKKHELNPIEKVGISAVRAVRDQLTDRESFRVNAVLVVPANGDPAHHIDPTDVLICVEGRAKNKVGGYVDVQGLALGNAPKTRDAVVLYLNHEATAFAQIFGLSQGGQEVAYGCQTLEGVDVTNVAKAALKTDREKE